jgi:F420-dependent methylenetetrahydromethanopterin dehydrogenase
MFNEDQISSFHKTITKADDAAVFLELCVKKEWDIVKGHFPNFFTLHAAQEVKTVADEVDSAVGFVTTTVETIAPFVPQGTEISAIAAEVKSITDGIDKTVDDVTANPAESVAVPSTVVVIQK